MALPSAPTRAGRLGGGVERAWRGSTAALSRYAQWLGGLSWKRFFLVALLVLVLAAIASNVPPFNLRWGPDRTVVQPPRKPALRISDDDPQRPYEIRIDDHGVRIGPAPGKAASAPDGAGMAKDGDAAGGADSAASAPRPPRPPQPSVDIKLPPGADADEVREAIEEARAEIKAALEEVRPRTRVIKGFSPGDYLPEFALLLILASIIVKVMGAGQRKAEARAAEAAEIAEGEALKRQVVEARMAAMQAQVEPHFLFNTLASIDHLIETDPARASRMQKNLIALLRASMPTMRETAASGAPRHLERELAVVRPYLEILKMRMEERLSVTDRRARRPAVGRVPADDDAEPGRERHQARPRAEARRRLAGREGRNRARQAGGDRGRHRARLRQGAGDRRHRRRAGQHPRAPAIAVRFEGDAHHQRKPAERHGRHGDGAVRRTHAGADMTRAVIADDERLMREQLRARLAEVWPELEIVAEAKNGEEAVALVEQHRPELVFLDIRMPGLTGVEAAKRIAQLPAAQLDAGAADNDDWACEIVFITAYDQYAVEAFEQGVVDYVLKPAERERLAITVDRIRKRLAARSSAEPASAPQLQQVLHQLAAQMTGRPPTYLRWIQASVGSTIQMIPVEDVLFFVSDEKYTRVQTASVEALIRKPIKELVDELDPQQFWQIHRRALVNTRHIAGVTRDLRGRQLVSVRGHGEQLEVSRSYAGLFKGM